MLNLLVAKQHFHQSILILNAGKSIMRNLSPSMGLFIASILVSHASLSSRLLAQSPTSTKATETQVIHHKTQKVDGLEIFYREAGPQSAPTIVLLHGFPTSSQMFSHLIPKLADKYHVIAPDYPDSGKARCPSGTEFEYSFDRLATFVDHLLEKLKVQSYVLYVQDYGAPIGYRIASAHPERVRGLIVQNGNAYDEVWTMISGSPSKTTGRIPRTLPSVKHCGYSATTRPNGNTRMEYQMSNASVPMGQLMINFCLSVRAIRTFSWIYF